MERLKKCAKEYSIFTEWHWF